MSMKRRAFIQAAGLAVSGAALPRLRPSEFSRAARAGTPAAGPRSRGDLSRVEARYYRKLPDREIECLLCPRLCRLGDKERGYCGVRENQGGTYYTLVYGKACSANVDPIEKKPFYHVLPGTNAFSIATAGCNVNCKFCQNWEISQARAEQVQHFDLPPAQVAAEAAGAGCPSVAYTYTEPTVFFEYMFDASVAARRRGLRNLVVSGGHINPEPLRDLLEVVDAVKIDLKAYDEKFYKTWVRGELAPVMAAIRTIAASRVWLEIVYLVIPTLNDDPAGIRGLARRLRDEIGTQTPLHFIRFHPMYLMKDLPPTPLETLVRARETALAEGLRFVYLGNVPGHEGSHTVCPGCGRTVIERFGFDIRRFDLEGGKCRSCGTAVPGLWT